MQYIIKWTYKGSTEYFHKVSKQGDTKFTLRKKSAQRFTIESFAELQVNALKMQFPEFDNIRVIEVTE